MTMLRLLFLFVPVFFLFCASQAQGENVPEVANLDGTPSLVISAFEDRDGNLEISDVRNMDFEPAGIDGINLGFTDSVCWIECTVTVEKEEEVFLEIAYPMLDDIRFYGKEDGVYKLQRYGDRFPHGMKEVLHPFFVIPLEPKKGVNRYYLRVQSKSSIIVPLNIYSEKEFRKRNLNLMMLYGLFYGILLIMILYNLFIFFSLRDISYIFYILYIFLFGLQEMAFDGSGPLLLWGEYPVMNNPSFYIFGVNIAILLFTRTYLNVRKKLRPGDYPLVTLIALGVTGLIVNIVFPADMSPYSAYLTLLTVATVIPVTVIIISRGERSAIFFLLSWIILLLSGGVRGLIGIGLVPMDPSFDTVLKAGSALQILLFSFALADRINVIKKQLEREFRAHLEADSKIREKNQELEALNEDLRASMEELEATNEEFEVQNEELIESQQELMESEATFRTLTESAPVGILIYRDDYWRHANPASETISGYSRDELLTMRYWDFIHPLDREMVKKRGYERQQGHDLVDNYEIRIERKDGESRWCNIRVVPLRYEGQQAFLLILIDITERKTAEEKLLLSEKKFSSAFKASPTLITITTLEEGAFMDVNDTFVRVSGFSREEVIGKTSRSMNLIPYSEDRKKLAYLLKRDGFVEKEITKYRTRSGEDRIGYFSANTIELQESPCVLSVVSDVTDLKRIEEALRESETKYRELVELLPQVICETDLEGNLTFSNRVGFEMTGYTPEDIEKGLNILDLLVPDDRERAVASMISLFQRGYQGGYEYTILRKDGGTFPAIIYSDLIENEENVIGVRSIVIDITKRKNAEAELRKREEQLMDISRNMPGVIYQFYFKKWEEWGFNYISEKSREILGLENNPDDFYVRFINRVPEATAIEMIRTLRRAIRNNSEWDYETEYIRPDGETIWIVLMASPAYYESEVLYNGFCFDITEQKNAALERERLEGQLRQAQKMEAIGRLAGGIAHDFNNLLTAIIGNADLAMETLDEKEPVYENIEDISLTAQRAAGLTRQLLAFSKKQIIAPTTLNLNDIIHAVERMLRRIIGEDIEMKLLPGEDLWNIKADPSQLEQLIFNLVVNSRDAMPEGGELIIETGNRELDEKFISDNPGSSPGPHVVLSVRDTGIGMEEEIEEKVFEPFFTTKGELGTGLGLSIVYGIVQQNGGFIKISSEPGEGTVFSLYFPAVKEGITVAAEKKGEDTFPGTSHGERILILEDEDAVRKLAVRALRESGYEILEASNGREALEICKEKEDEIDLILSDVVVPGLSGPDLVDTIRRTCPKMKAIFMSGYTEHSISQNGILRDDIHFIPKPFRPIELIRKVREVLDGDSD